MTDLILAFITLIDGNSRARLKPVQTPAAIVAQAAPSEAGRVDAQPAGLATVLGARAAVRHETEERERGKRLHRFIFTDGAQVEFTDRPRRGGERADRERVVIHTGTQDAALEPAGTFEAAGREAGLTPEAVDALRYVSSHEGGFDAINTWDQARFSWGFIQFAGGRGLPPLLGHMKDRNPALFARLFAEYGIDVLQDERGKPEPAYLDPNTGRLLRGDAAEQAFGDDPLAVALFIRAAGYPEIKQLQVEAAIKNYAAPALQEAYRGVPLGSVLRSPKGMAMLIDRKVHEGNVGRFTRALDAVGGLRMGEALEAAVMQRVVSEATARSPRMISDRLTGIMYSSLPGPVAMR